MKKNEIPGQGKRPDQYESTALIVFSAMAALAFIALLIALNILK